MLARCCRETGAPGSAICTHEEAAGCPECSRQVQVPESQGAGDAISRPWSQKMTVGTLLTTDSTSTTSNDAGLGLLTSSSTDDRQQRGPPAGLQQDQAVPLCVGGYAGDAGQPAGSSSTMLCCLCLRLQDDTGHPAAAQQQDQVLQQPTSASPAPCLIYNCFR